MNNWITGLIAVLQRDSLLFSFFLLVFVHVLRLLREMWRIKWSKQRVKESSCVLPIEWTLEVSLDAVCYLLVIYKSLKIIFDEFEPSNNVRHIIFTSNFFSTSLTYSDNSLTTANKVRNVNTFDDMYCSSKNVLIKWFFFMTCLNFFYLSHHTQHMFQQF